MTEEYLLLYRPPVLCECGVGWGGVWGRSGSGYSLSYLGGTLPPPVNRQTENITFPKPSVAGGKNVARRCFSSLSQINGHNSLEPHLH